MVEFTLALVELRLAGLSCVGLMKRLAEQKPDLPVIAMSARGTMDDVISVLREGGADYLKKPISSDALKAALERIFHAPRESQPVVATIEESEPVLSAEEKLQAALEELADGGELPPSPALLPAIQRLMEDLTCGVGQILEVVGRDSGVAAEVLRTAQASHRIKEDSLRDVTLKLGNRRVLATAHEVVLRNSLGVGEGPLGRVGKKLWNNVQVTARGTRELAGLMGLPDPDGFYVDGLLHNVGGSVMLRVFSKHLEEDDVRELTTERLAKEIEGAHQQVGRRVLEAWEVPSKVNPGRGVPSSGRPPAVGYARQGPPRTRARRLGARDSRGVRLPAGADAGSRRPPPPGATRRRQGALRVRRGPHLGGERLNGA